MYSFYALSHRIKFFLPLTRSDQTGDMSLSRSTTAGTASIILSISSSVLPASMVRRSEPCATSCGLPIASRTWLGSSEPEVQALPEEAHIPAASSRSSRLSPSIPSKQKLTFPGRRLTGSPFSAECGIRDSPAMSLSRRDVTYAESCYICAHAYSSAAAIPTIAGIFSVPARFPRS